MVGTIQGQYSYPVSCCCGKAGITCSRLLGASPVFELGVNVGLFDGVSGYQITNPNFKPQARLADGSGERGRLIFFIDFILCQNVSMQFSYNVAYLHENETTESDEFVSSGWRELCRSFCCKRLCHAKVRDPRNGSCQNASGVPRSDYIIK
eukprot:746230-Hanusia_phi.AAC.3